MMTAAASKLNQRNCRQWAIKAETVLFRQGLWKFVTGGMRVPSSLIIPSTSGETPTTPKLPHDPRDCDYNIEPKSTEPAYLSSFDIFLRDWERWLMNNDKASGQITDMMKPTMQVRYREYKKLQELREKIKADFANMVKLDGQHKLKKLVLRNLESYSSVAEWISAQDALIGDLAICDIPLMTMCENSISYRTSHNQMNGRCPRPPWSSVGKQTLQQISSHICNHSRSPSSEMVVLIPTEPDLWQKRAAIGNLVRPATGRGLCAMGVARMDITLWTAWIHQQNVKWFGSHNWTTQQL